MKTILNWLSKIENKLLNCENKTFSPVVIIF